MPRLFLAQGMPLEPQLVYAHRFPGETAIFHIGSGPYSRSLKGERGKPWLEHVGERDVEVDILETHECPARARLRESQLIHDYQPITNIHHRRGPHPRVLGGYTKKGDRCDCGAVDCYGR